ncbi:MAG: phosphatidylserine decarboxylase family protein [Nitrospirae bacterium]|nr:phosphatidylserine decarboxylase family protein [Nitrospirota bacterium]MBI3351709.1 phosphatidylserine decarboxylase family protein [Nitrospirota bacterium]
MTKTKTRTFPIATEGFPYVFAGIGATLLSLLFGLTSITVFFGLVTVFVLQFFRNPNRKGSQEEGVILSPADGEIISVELIQEDRFLKDKAIKISIFMNVFNVHVNRAPYSGVVKKISYTRGKFFAANAEKASLENEQNAILLETDKGKKILFIQIAGLIARRIICYAKEGDRLEKGERCGIIKFGSRVDLYLPSDSKVAVKAKEKVKGGETVIGVLS